MGARQPAGLDALLLLIESISNIGRQSEGGPTQAAPTVAKLSIDAGVATE